MILSKTFTSTEDYTILKKKQLLENNFIKNYKYKSSDGNYFVWKLTTEMLFLVKQFKIKS